MTIEMITSLITTLGLPVVLILAMGWFIFKLWKQSAEREQELYEELTKSREMEKKFRYGKLVMSLKIKNIM